MISIYVRFVIINEVRSMKENKLDETFSKEYRKGYKDGKLIHKQKLEHAPTLNTVLMVENTLKNMEGSIITIAELKRRLPKQVNHNTLKIILEYLEESNKIAVSLKGITWIHNTSPNLRRAIAQGLEI